MYTSVLLNNINYYMYTYTCIYNYYILLNTVKEKSATCWLSKKSENQICLYDKDKAYHSLSGS